LYLVFGGILVCFFGSIEKTVGFSVFSIVERARLV
jgi:hypothetical protein